MQVEVEQKFPLADAAAIEQRLLDLGARFAGAVTQSDRYFNHPAHDFAQTDEALRIRSVGEINFITYKGPRLDYTSKTRQEIELPLASGPDQAEHYAQLLKALKFREVATVTKSRREAEFAWQGTPVHAMLDEVAGLGSFLELEIVTSADGISAAQATLQSLATALGLGSSERRSYLELLLEKTSQGSQN
jgi:adenylate cyclase class 2